jgi:hypothetical protein
MAVKALPDRPVHQSETGPYRRPPHGLIPMANRRRDTSATHPRPAAPSPPGSSGRERHARVLAGFAQLPANDQDAHGQQPSRGSGHGERPARQSTIDAVAWSLLVGIAVLNASLIAGLTVGSAVTHSVVWILVALLGIDTARHPEWS